MGDVWVKFVIIIEKCWKYKKREGDIFFMGWVVMKNYFKILISKYKE